MFLFLYRSKRNNNTGSLLLKNSSFKINPNSGLHDSASCNVKLIKLNWLPSFFIAPGIEQASQNVIKVTSQHDLSVRRKILQKKKLYHQMIQLKFMPSDQ